VVAAASKHEETVRIAALCFLLAACTRHSVTGTISGHLFAVGGPYPGLPRPLLGVVFVSGSQKLHVVVGIDGDYWVVVRAGTYSISGRSPQYQGGHLVCHARSRMTVAAGTDFKADVFCQEY
jgi:hypothetical protein